MNVNDLVMVISVGDYVEISFLIGHSGTIVQISNEPIVQLVDDSYIINDDNKKLFVVEFDEEIEVLSDEQIHFKTKYIGFEKHELMILKDENLFKNTETLESKTPLTAWISET